MPLRIRVFSKEIVESSGYSGFRVGTIPRSGNYSAARFATPASVRLHQIRMQHATNVRTGRDACDDLFHLMIAVDFR
jgi:hypothetical protein